MKYYLLETAPWETFYSAAAETTETIVNEFVSAYADYTKAEKFDRTKHQPAKHMSGVKNDENIYILYRITGEPELWQIGSKVSDITGYIIPGLFMSEKSVRSYQTMSRQKVRWRRHEYRNNIP